MKKLLLNLSVVFVAYLVVSVSFVYATTISIRSQGVEYSTQEIDGSGLVNKQIVLHKDAPFYFNIEVEISLQKASEFDIEKIYVFKCRNSDPIGCADLEPEVFSGGFSGKRYKWDHVSGTIGPGPFDQIANIMYLVKLNSRTGSDVWMGFWDSIKRNGQISFSDPPYGFSLGTVNLEKTSNMQTVAIDNFIKNNRMMPLNPEWSANVEFLEALGIHELKSAKTEIEVPAFETNYNPLRKITSMDKEYYFAFPKTQNGFANPLTLNLNPSYVCGNGVKETGLGENEQNCCYDFGCSLAGSYCDTGVLSCRQENNINLKYTGRPALKVPNCNTWNDISVNVKIENAPGKMSFISKTQNIGPYVGPLSCSGGSETGFAYTCTLTVPPQPGCGSGDLEIGPNSIEFLIDFDNGQQRKTKEIVASLPDITLGSFTSGDGACERSLGESEQNSCFDCGCYTGKYCDFVIPQTAECKNDLASSDVYVSDVSPANFPFYRSETGDSFDFVAHIRNSPVSLAVMDEKCLMGCSSETDCSADCYLQCGSFAQKEGEAVSSCRTEFLIRNYNKAQSYSLSPTINLSVTYRNSTGQISKTISARVNTISTGQNYPGDGVCSPAEDSSTNCFDCGCDLNSYCDTQSRSGPTEGDVCRPLSEMNVNIIPVSDTNLIDTGVAHDVIFALTMGYRPGGLAIRPDCSLGGIECKNISVAVVCEENQVPSGYSSNCTIRIPKINYKQSQFYIDEIKKIVFRNNILNLSLGFNNGLGSETRDYLFNIPDITIEPVAKCGNSVLEPDLGENSESCCIDAGCGNNLFCYTGENPNGRCISSDAIQMKIKKMNPENISCPIFFAKEKCTYVGEVEIIGEIINPPDFEIESPAFFKIDGKHENTQCYRSGPESEITCSILMPDFGGTEPRIIEKQLSLTVTISHKVNETRVVKNLSASTNIKINIFKDRSLVTREEQLAKMDDQISKIRKYRNIIYGFLVAAGAACAAICIVASTNCIKCGNVLACVTASVVPYISQQESKLAELKNARQGLYNSIQGGDSIGASDFASDSGREFAEILGFTAAGVCIYFGVFKPAGLATTSTISGGASIGGPRFGPPIK